MSNAYDFKDGDDHEVECPDCEGGGIARYWHNGRVSEECYTCDGKGFCIEPASAEDCDCNKCVSGYWFWPSPVGDKPAIHYGNLDSALRAGTGEVTKRQWQTKLVGLRNPVRYIDHVRVCVSDQ